MPYASLRQAIRERFEQYATDVVPTATAMGDGRAYGDEPMMLDLRVGGRALRVCVYNTDMGGKPAHAWPAITYKQVSERARREDTHFGDVLRRALGTAFQHDAMTLEERSGADLYEMLPGPEPIDITYEFRVWALRQDEAELLLGVLKQLWPQIGHVVHTQRDGSLSDIDVIRTEGPTFVGGEDPTLPEGDPEHRFWAWSVRYVFQAYEDNTLQTTLVPTVRKRVLELGDEDTDSDPAAVVELDEHGSP